MLNAINDRSKIERQNRELAVRRASMASGLSLDSRLEAIEKRLSRIELALSRDRRD
jgi:hypothetical protein